MINALPNIVLIKHSEKQKVNILTDEDAEVQGERKYVLQIVYLKGESKIFSPLVQYFFQYFVIYNQE